jgi:hypothetical protein
MSKPLCSKTPSKIKLLANGHSEDEIRGIIKSKNKKKRK